MNELKENDLVMCTVKSIDGTTIFLDIEGFGQGTLSLPEVAAGRIRNLREYVSPNKKIVCKILKIVNGHPQLSLRRVTAKERDEITEKFKKEKTIQGMLKTITEDPQKIIDKIKAEKNIIDFFDEAKENPKLLEKYFSKPEAEKLSKLIFEKREREKEVKKEITLKSNSDSGIKDIKSILNTKDIQIKYLGSSRFSLEAKSNDFKDANIKLLNATQEMQKRTKEKKAILEIKE